MVHCHGNHWVTAHKSNNDDSINVYDSVFSSVDNATRKILQNLFEVSNNFQVNMVLSQKREEGSNNCGLFAIATATSVALKFYPTSICIKYTEKEMRNHFCNCLERHSFCMFPYESVL